MSLTKAVQQQEQVHTSLSSQSAVPTCCGSLPPPNQPPNQLPLPPLPSSPLLAPLLEAKPPSGDCSSPSGEAPSGAAIGADGSGAGAAINQHESPSDAVAFQ